MKWKKQLCATAAVLLALGIALAGVLLNQHFLVLSGGISRTEIQSPLGDWVRSHLQLVALIVFATLAAAILALYHYKKQPELRYFLLYLAVLFFWGTLVAFFPAGFQGLLQRFMRLFLPSRSWRRPCSPQRCWPCLCPPNGWCPPRQSFCCWGKSACPSCGSAY